MAKKTGKNLVANRSEYNTYYGDFRGVDFSSDHTQVHNNRFAYLLNMYKDYKSANGTAIETIPGFRRLFSLSMDGSDKKDKEIYGIHNLNGAVIVHIGNKLVRWENYPYTCGIKHTASVVCTEEMKTEENFFKLDINLLAQERGGRLGKEYKVTSARSIDTDGNPVDIVIDQDDRKGKIIVFSALLKVGSVVTIDYLEDTAPEKEYKSKKAAFHKSVSFKVGNNNMLILDGNTMFRVFYEGNDGSFVLEEGLDYFAYIPTTYHHLRQDGENKPTDTARDQRNLLSPYFKNEFYGAETETQHLQLMARASEINLVTKIDFTTSRDGTATETDIPPYGVGSENGYTYNKETGEITIPMKSSRNETFVVTATYLDGQEMSAEYKKRLAGCAVGCLFANRLFLSGNKDYPNTVWFSTPKDKTGYQFAFGADDWFNDGVNNTPVTGMIAVGDNLLVLKENADEGGAAYLHSKLSTEDNVVTTAYPREQGLQGIGCLGACTNFFDDPVFISKRGLSALGQLSVRNERALEHRSSLIDAKLTNMDLRKAFVEEFGGYLLLFVDGCMFMADSRQRYTDDLGIVQYEWYYVEGVGVNVGQSETENDGCVGGEFCPATCAKTMDDNLFFGTTSGHVCAFNFDQRTEYGDFLPSSYTFDGRKIVSGCATKMDNCGIPHLTKSTVKKSMVIKVKALLSSALKVNVRTNNDPYKTVNRLGTALFTFEDIDFEDFSFLTSDSGLLVAREKEKKWVEKQIYICSDEYMKPFALHYIAFRYIIAGRFKN